MIETIHLLPPDLGPRSNPVLFGIAEALAVLLPLVVHAPRPAAEPAPKPEPAIDADRVSRTFEAVAERA